jgi:hypothetical protein
MLGMGWKMVGEREVRWEEVWRAEESGESEGERVRVREGERGGKEKKERKGRKEREKKRGDRRENKTVRSFGVPF